MAKKQYNEVTTQQERMNNQYSVYLDGLVMGVQPKQWMMPAFVQMLKQSFIELEDKKDEDVVVIAQKWLNERDREKRLNKGIYNVNKING